MKLLLYHLPLVLLMNLLYRSAVPVESTPCPAEGTAWTIETRKQRYPNKKAPLWVLSAYSKIPVLVERSDGRC